MGLPPVPKTGRGSVPKTGLNRVYRIYRIFERGSRAHARSSTRGFCAVARLPSGRYAPFAPTPSASAWIKASPPPYGRGMRRPPANGPGSRRFANRPPPRRPLVGGESLPCGRGPAGPYPRSHATAAFADPAHGPSNNPGVQYRPGTCLAHRLEGGPAA